MKNKNHIKKKEKSRFPTKEEVMQALLEEDEKVKGFNKYILIIEYRKISEKLGIIRGELIQDDKIIFKGKMTQLPETQVDSFDWDMLEIGESYFEGYSLDYKGETISQLMKQGFKKSLKEGRLPFIPK